MNSYIENIIVNDNIMDTDKEEIFKLFNLN